MNKPGMLLLLSGQPEKSSQVVTAPSAVGYQPTPMNAGSSRAVIPATRPAQAASASVYVDPYLFETGYYASQAEQAEQEELTRTAASRIQLRADVENARPKRRNK